MYERSAEGWAKHLDFILLDMICLEISLHWLICCGMGFTIRSRQTAIAISACSIIS